MKKTRNIVKIDYIRIISCIGVLLYHLGILKGGYLAVCTFFVVSGYLSAVSFLKRKQFSFKEYYLSRLLNIYLPLLVVTFSTIALVSLFPDIVWVNLKKETTSVILGYNNYWQIAANLDYFTRHISSPFMHMWYIAILLQYDLIFPLIYTVLRNASRKVSKLIPIAALGVAGIISFIVFCIRIGNEDVMFAYYSSFSRLFSFVFGAMLGFIHAYIKPIVLKDKNISKIAFNIYLILLAIMFVFFGSGNENIGLYMLLTTIVSMRLIDYAVVDRETRSNVYVKLLSGMSYDIYLLQYPVIFLFQNMKITPFIKVPLMIICILILSFIFFEARSVMKMRKKDPIRIIMCILIIISSVFGAYKYITAEDHSAEMKDLEEKLNENQKLIEEKNKEFLNNEKADQDEWSQTLQNMENEEEAVSEMLKKLKIVGVGDSILLDVVDKLYEKFPDGYFDCKISRSLYAGEEILRDLKAEGKLSNTLLLCLANNGDYSTSINEELMNIVEDRDVFWINAVGADDPEFNERFAKFAENYPNLHIIDWVSVSEGHPEYFYYDNIHVMGEGVDVLSDTIYQTIYNTYLNKFADEKNTTIQNHENELKSRISFYGNDLLINSYSYLSNIFDKAIYNIDSEYTYDSLYEALSNDIKNKTVEANIVLLFDKQADITVAQYKNLVDLCKDYELYICDTSGKGLVFYDSHVTVINFYQQLADNEEYLMADKQHLSDEGNKALSNTLADALRVH